MNGNDWYKDWFNSPFYHKLYFDRDEAEAEAFIKNLLNYLDPPREARMLDVACGKGRHSKILASFGYHVTGLDIPPASIDAALADRSENLEFAVHDMRLPFHGNYFDYAFNFFTSFGYFKTRREHNDAIRSIANSLKPGGVFMIDYLNVRYAEQTLQAKETKQIDDTLYSIERWHDDTHFYKKIIVTDPGLTQSLEFTEKVAKFNLDDFTGMLGIQDMEVTNVFGNYNLGTYDETNAPRLIVISSKKNPAPADKEKGSTAMAAQRMR